LLRPALFRRKELAVETVRRLGHPRVLDVGCGPGRIAEPVLEAGAREYVGIDFSEPMIALALERLARFGDRVRLLTGDFLDTPLGGPFDVVLALGLFDYTPDPSRFAARMLELCRYYVVASFPRWTVLRGPVRKLRYEVVNDCPIFHYDERAVRQIFSGFASVEVMPVGRSALLARAEA
jgi:SAM-dependent methyltransferase